MAEYNLVAALTSSSLESDVDFDYRVCVKMMQCKSLEPNYFRAYWAKHVPAIFSPQLECDCLNISYDEDLAREVLFLPLEQFVCNTSEPSKFFEHMKTVGSIPSLCGRVFKAGEPTYSCRDCGLDPTCVVCVDCFTKSAHRFHRYKMSTSGGGGYCDCGDEEAWKSDCFCEIHHKGKSEVTSSSNPLDKLPTDIIDRLKFVMRLVLQYSYQMLTWIHAVDLPHDLQTTSQVCENYELPDTYCTVLFNDETHTYEQVIETLSKAISCSKKAAIDFATTIDREGRSIVKCSKYAACNHARHIIERITTRHVANSLKVMVMHTDVVSHQTFSMRLLTWLQKLLGIHEGFRLVFSQVMMEPMDHDTCTLLENIMVSDTQLWKSARNQYHQLFISGMLMDQHCKKVFAKVFARNYPILIKDFMADDHDHSISVTSLSVQIFTVPTLAHALIEEDDVITILLRAFLTECERNKNEDGKLAFQRNQMTSTFRRAHYILYDLKYLVTVIPSKWSDELRIHFLYGLQSYLNLLNFMQGMDSVVRQVGHHIEYEAEWETGINLQLRVATISTLLVQWCGSDFWVFVKAFRATLRMLSITSSPHSRPFCIPIEIANHSTNCIEYDVSAMPVTIHLPLSRFAAGLFLHLEKFDLYYDSSQFQLENAEKPSPEYLMEFPLRTLVMLAQFRAGMWRRNGYSLLNQIYFYHNVRFRDEMFDRDIVMLQIAASLIESNEFLIHLVYKFGLINWADPKYDGVIKKSEDESIRQVLTVAEEFLSLLLTIVSERFTPGIGKVSESDRIKKEIIQLLCIEPMPHSLIYKMLPKDPNNETGMEDVVSEVASFKKPQGPGTGKYELKEEFLKCFNPFYYHYTKEEQSKAEETQLKRKKQMGHELCCPPPVPPEFTPRFSIITNILQCDVMLHILHMIFSRTLNLHCAVFSEAQFEKVLHIVGVALHEEEHAFAGERENSFFNFTSRAVGQGIPPLMEECVKSARVESQKDLLRWVLAKFKSVESLRANKSGENSCVNASSAEEGESLAQNRKHRAELAAARKARIMAQMTNLQLNFMKEHADLFREAVLEDTVNVSQTQLDSMELGTDDPVSIGCKQKGKVICQKIHTCILCREDQEVSCSGRALVLAAFVQRSSVLSKVRKSNKNSVIKEPHDYDPLQFSSDLSCAPHVSTCGHVMHSDCWQKFFESVLRKEQRRPLRFGRHTSFEVDKNEYLCPLCERLSNTVIPIIPQLTLLGPEKDFNIISISIDDWLSAMKKAVEEFQFEKINDPPPDDNKAKYLTHHYLPLRLSEVIEELPEAIRHQFLDMFSSLQTCLYANPEFSEHLLEMMKLFSQTTYTVGLQCDPNLTDSRVPAMSWWSCAYTIHAIEWLLREQKKPLFGKLSSRTALCLEAMVRFSGASLRVFDHNVVRTQSVRLLRYLLLGEHYLSSPQCALDLDAFAVLIFLVLSMPVLFQCDDQKKYEPVLCPLGSVLDAYLMHLMYIFHLVQLLLSYPFNDENAMQIDEVNEVFEVNEEVVAMHFYQDIRTASGLDQSMPTPSGRAIVNCIKSGSMPFLRCAALFFHVLTDTAPPANLEEISDMEFEHTCKYLGLPTSMNELLMSPSLKQLALSWARHPRTLHLLQRTSELTEASKDSEQAVGCLVHHPMSVNHIVQLPNDYSELINSASLFTCPNSDGDDSRNPTMCLVCGTVLCSQSYCCQIDLDGTMVGACTHHAHYCGCGIGIFLRIRDCKILLLSDKNKGCFMPPPYVDDYGETDQGLFRGNPLHLCREKYEELNELWLSHNIPEQVSHMMEQSTTLPNWQLL